MKIEDLTFSEKRKLITTLKDFGFVKEPDRFIKGFSQTLHFKKMQFDSFTLDSMYLFFYKHDGLSVSIFRDNIIIT